MSTPEPQAACIVFRDRRLPQWEGSQGDIVQAGPDVHSEQFWSLSFDASATSPATPTEIIIRTIRTPVPGAPAVWRGTHIVDEAEFASSEFPYPPEPDWDRT